MHLCLCPCPCLLLRKMGKCGVAMPGPGHPPTINFVFTFSRYFLGEFSFAFRTLLRLYLFATAAEVGLFPPRFFPGIEFAFCLLFAPGTGAPVPMVLGPWSMSCRWSSHLCALLHQRVQKFFVQEMKLAPGRKTPR